MSLGGLRAQAKKLYENGPYPNTICMSLYTVGSRSPSVLKQLLHECPLSSRPVRRRAPSGLAKHAPSRSSTLWGMPRLPPQLPTIDPAATEDLTPMVSDVSWKRIISIEGKLLNLRAQFWCQMLSRVRLILFEHGRIKKL